MQGALILSFLLSVVNADNINITENLINEVEDHDVWCPSGKNDRFLFCL